MSYMDQRAREELKKGIAYGPQIAGANIPKLLKALKITGAVAASVKDPVWKYKWVEAHEPDAFNRAPPLHQCSMTYIRNAGARKCAKSTA